MKVTCKTCKHNRDEKHTWYCKVSGVRTRPDYEPTICYGYEKRAAR